mgnify:CR=1 FL=1
MSKKRRWISTILILVGIAIAAFPVADRVYKYYWQQRLLEAFEDDIQLEEVAPELVESDYLALQAIYESEDEGFIDPESSGNPTSTAENSDPSGTTESTTAPAPTGPKKPDKSVIGKIRIDKIDLLMPVLMGASEKNLNRGAAVISGTSSFGEIGNVGIAGHRGRSYGIFFNRFDELEVNDTIEITTADHIYKYTIYKIHIVEPTDVSVLYRNKTDKILTLVTCDPVKNPTHRLIVHALQNP